MQDQKAMQVLLSARSIVYAALGRAFADEPNEDLVGLFVGRDFADVCSAFDGEACVLSEALSRVASAGRRRGADGCSREYARMFVGQQMDVYPYESVHVTGERLVFQACTLEVRRAYQAQGFQAVGYPHEPDDHVATELHFMAKLAERALRELEEGDAAACSAALSASFAFLEGHLGLWVKSFARSFREADGLRNPDGPLETDGPESPCGPKSPDAPSFYGALARFAATFVAMDEGFLRETEAVFEQG